MKKIWMIALVVSIVAVASEGLAAPSDGIAQTFAALDRCLATNDAKCVGELLVDDATFAFAEGGSRVIKNKAQVVKTLEEVMGVPAPNMKGAKRTHTVQSIRMIGEDHAVVDASITVGETKPAEGATADPPAGYHAIAVMVLKGGTWLFEDLRSYVVGPAHEPAAAAANKAAPPASEPAPPAQN